MSRTLLRRVVVPVADADDARETAEALELYAPERVTAVYVIEHTESAPDVLSPEQAQEHGTEALGAFREVYPDAGTEVVAAEDIVDGVLEVARDVQASAIAFRPRGGSRLVQFLSGDTALRLVTEADRPVIALPEDATEQPDADATGGAT